MNTQPDVAGGFQSSANVAHHTNDAIRNHVEQLAEAAKSPTTAGTASCSTLAFTDNGEATNTAIPYAVTVGYRVTAPNIIALRDISYVMNCVKSGIVEGTDIRALVHTIRNTPNEALARAMKANLPYFLGSQCERTRSNSNVKHAQFFILDLDHVADIEQTKADAIASFPWLRWAFRSVRDGVKLVGMFDRPVTREEDYRVLWQYHKIQVERALGVKVDSTPDWSRACFFSFDPGLLYNSAWQAVNVPVALKEAEFVLRLAENLQTDKTEGQRDRETQAPITQRRTTVIPAPEPESSLFLTSSSQPEPSESFDSSKTGFRVKPGMTEGSEPANTGQTGTFATPYSKESQSQEDDFTQARAIVERLATCVIPYRDWIRIGMALYSGFGEAGKALWDIFLTNPHYTDTAQELDKHWRSFRSVRSIKLATLFYIGEHYAA